MMKKLNDLLAGLPMTIVAGVFLLLGTGTGTPLHADTFDFDERVLLTGVDAYRRLLMMP